MSWTENPARYWVTEPMARISIPSQVECKTDKCPGVAKRHCKVRTCCWFFCDICDTQMWWSPRVGKGPLGMQVIAFKLAASVRMGGK